MGCVPNYSPPSALGIEPQPAATESAGATPRVEPKGYGATALPRGEGQDYTNNIRDFVFEIGNLKGIGKIPERGQIFKSYNNQLKPIGEANNDLVKQLNIDDKRVYTSKAYFIDHHFSNHPNTEPIRYYTIPDVLNNPTEIRLDNRDATQKKYIFIKQYDKYHTIVVDVGIDRGRLVLYKTFFAQNKRPYENLPLIRSESAREGDISSIGPATESSSPVAPPEAISARQADSSRTIPPPTEPVKPPVAGAVPPKLSEAEIGRLLGTKRALEKELGARVRAEGNKLTEEIFGGGGREDIFDRIKQITSGIRVTKDLTMRLEPEELRRLKGIAMGKKVPLETSHTATSLDEIAEALKMDADDLLEQMLLAGKKERIPAEVQRMAEENVRGIITGASLYKKLAEVKQKLGEGELSTTPPDHYRRRGRIRQNRSLIKRHGTP